jgi:hypothetical protein
MQDDIASTKYGCAISSYFCMMAQKANAGQKANVDQTPADG